MAEEKKIIQLDEKDANRLAKIKKVLDESTILWDSAVKILVPEYLLEFKDKKVEVMSIDGKEMTVKIE